MGVLIRLFILFLESKEELSILDAISTLVGGNTKIIINTLKNLTLRQELELRKRFGNTIVNRAKSAVNIKPLNIGNGAKSIFNPKPVKVVKRINKAIDSRKKDIVTNARADNALKPINKENTTTTTTNITTKNDNHSIPTTATTKSGWIESISWMEELHMLTLKTKKSPIYYKLPFFPRHVAEAMLKNASPGKTLWNGYWRPFGRGGVGSSVITKRIRSTTQSNVVARMNRLSNKSAFGKKILTNSQIRRANIPKSNIKIKRPKLK